jgi:hypothetical protein
MKLDAVTETISLSALVGAIIGIGHLLSSDEELTLRMAMGRAIVSAGLASSAPVVLLWFPKMPSMVEFGVAALLASLGTSGLQSILHIIFRRDR